MCKYRKTPRAERAGSLVTTYCYIMLLQLHLKREHSRSPDTHRNGPTHQIRNSKHVKFSGKFKFETAGTSFILAKQKVATLRLDD